MEADMRERLQKIIAASGLCSRRDAERLITAGRVRVNGEPAALGQAADAGRDRITLDDRPLRGSARRTYIMLNKPRAYLSSVSDDRGRRTVSELTADAGARLYPVGRLDYNSEGLLIMTNDGAFAQLLTHPSHEIGKVYELRVRGGDIPRALAVLRAPLEIDGYRTRPAKARLLSRTEDGARLSVTIYEGRNRQIRKMCAQAGLTVLRLRRVAEGSLALGALPSGKWRYLEPAEIDSLQKCAKKPGSFPAEAAEMREF
jgi:23S rRNA pseudouridine2605 synthase